MQKSENGSVAREKRCEKQVREWEIGSRSGSGGHGAKYRKLSVVEMDARWMRRNKMKQLHSLKPF